MLNDETRPLAVIQQRVALRRGEASKSPHAVQSRGMLQDPATFDLDFFVRPHSASRRRLGEDWLRFRYRLAPFDVVATVVPLAGVVDQSGRPCGDVFLATVVLGDSHLRLGEGSQGAAVIGLEVEDLLVTALGFNEPQ